MACVVDALSLLGASQLGKEVNSSRLTLLESMFPEVLVGILDSKDNS